MKFCAPCLFGVEGLLSDELKRMDIKNVTPENGCVTFEGDMKTLCRVNLRSRVAERVLLVLGEFPARSFDELFENVKKLPLENYIGRTDAFPVKGWSLNSKLHSVPDIQKIIKKAMVSRLSNYYGISWFEETGAKNQIQFSILKDRARIMIDTSGEGLHKRGYRENANAAPIRETLAAAMAYAARVYPDSVMYDPFCGSGTILIESALIAHNIAPGLHRGFALEGMPWVDQNVFVDEREAAFAQINRNHDFIAYASDIDKRALGLCAQNAKKAGVDYSIKTTCADIRDFKVNDGKGLIITNPPYGERLLDRDNARELYRIMGEKFISQRGWRYYIITPDEDFEGIYGKKADKRRKLYNGMIKCQMYMYFK
ncbi:MAG: class I SAM-dependent RNA methyltransferase [Acutalibacteraceae bacterium]|nr:class I SAM-dependent RNA methyltransferase [Clostridia bacterium]MEE1144904.1 class I SAM-dependent RNA methyltransferase [Acutalibacteraceae bacterium]